MDVKVWMLSPVSEPLRPRFLVPGRNAMGTTVVPSDFIGLQEPRRRMPLNTPCGPSPLNSRGRPQLQRLDVGVPNKS